MSRSAYMAEVECSLISDSGATVIDTMFIKTIAVDYGYQTTYMPIIYLMGKFPSDVYGKIKEGQKTSKIYLRISKYNAYSSTSISHKDIDDQFTYIVSDTSNADYQQDLDENPNADTVYYDLQLALMSMDIMNRYRSSFNGIYGEIDQATLVLKAMEGLNVVIKPLLYNPTYDTILIPPLNSKKKVLEYLYSKCPFYDTNYLFFIDFEKSYLTDLTGEPYDAQDGQLLTVMFDVSKFTNATSYYEGVETKNGAYYMYVNPADIDITSNKGADKMSNQYVFIGDNGGVDYVDLDINNNPDADVKQAFMRGNNPILYKNMAESNTIIAEIVKENVDSSIFTPNKEYVVVNSTEYEEYNGNYTLLSKKEYFVNNSGEFGMSTTIRLRKVGNITAIGMGVVKEAMNRSSSLTRKTTSSKGQSTSRPTTSSSSSSSAKGTSSGNGKISGNVMSIPTAKRIRATSDMSLRRQPRKISGEG